MLKIALFFLAGMSGWSFTEYGLHNWYGHKMKGKNEFSREHLAHHVNNTYFAANWKKTIATLKVTPFIFLLVACTAGLLNGFVFTLGFLFFYSFYEILHRRIHTHAPQNFYSKFLRKNHFSHHFSNPKFNHGVTSPIWDLIFGTYKKPGVVSVPEKNVMKWLLDENLNVKAEYQNDYSLLKTHY